MGTDTKRRYAKSYAVDFKNVGLTDGFWKERWDACRVGSVPTLYDRMVDPHTGRALRNMEIAAGIADGEYSGNTWMDAWVYKWIEAASYVYAQTHDDALDHRMDRCIAVIARVQERDGYVSSKARAEKADRFVNILDHELYIMGHLITAACVHRRLTGKKSLLAIAERCADFLYRTFIQAREPLSYFGFNPSQIMALVDLYRVTGRASYLELANTFIDNKGSHDGIVDHPIYPKNPTPNWGTGLIYAGSDNNQDRIPLREETQMVGHSVLSSYLYCGAADAYMETGDVELKRALERIFDDFVGKRMYISGGACSKYVSVSTRSRASGNRRYYDVIVEGVGDDYELPNTSAYNESCAQVGVFMWAWRMLLITGEAKYADLMEREMYNGFLPGVSLDGRTWFYANPLRFTGADYMAAEHLNHKRVAPPEDGTCCPTNVTRTVAGIASYFYSTDDSGIFVHHYGSGSVELPRGNGTILLEQSTDYPWDGTVRIALESTVGDPFTVSLRIPTWAEAGTISIDGDAAVDASPGEYFTVTRVWEGTHHLVLELPMTVDYLESHPLVEETRNQIAVTRGPLLYCLESQDIEADGLTALDLFVDPTDILRAVPRKIEGARMTVLEGTFYAADNSWSGDLYRKVRPNTMSAVQATMVPYFAWANRGTTEMTVWLKARHSP